MFSTPPSHLLLRRSKTIILTGVILAVASVVITVLFPLEYRADAQVLVIAQSRYGVDPYTTIKSAEKIGENIAQIIKTNDFFDKVTAQSSYALDLTRFEGVPERTKRKRWQKTVDASVVYGTGVLNISAYNEDPNQAMQYAGAVAEALVAYGSNYVGGDVVIKMVNSPVATRIPVRPNLALNALLGFVAGALAMGLVVLKKG